MEPSTHESSVFGKVRTNMSRRLAYLGTLHSSPYLGTLAACFSRNGQHCITGRDGSLMSNTTIAVAAACRRDDAGAASSPVALAEVP